MKLNKTSYTSMNSVIQEALEKYTSMEGRTVVTDIYLQPNMLSGELLVFNDDDELLASTVIGEWENANPEEFLSSCELALKKVLNQMSSEGKFASLPIMKPYSFVMVDGEKVADIKQTFPQDAFAGDGVVVKRGKKNFRRVKAC